VCNAIDAGATNVAVRVDFNCHRIQVVDNGHGIDKKNLENIAERFVANLIFLQLLNCMHYYIKSEKNLIIDYIFPQAHD
jgi:hypothetical protein